MAEGDLIMSTVVDGAPVFPCGGCGPCPDAVDYQLTLAGIGICDTCIFPGSGFFTSFVLGAFDFNGVMNLLGGLSDPSHGSWTKTFTDIPFTFWPSNDCSGDSGGSDIATGFANFTCVDGDLSFRIFANSNTGFLGLYTYFFLATGITIGEPFDNQLDECGSIAHGVDPLFPSNDVIVGATGGTGLIELP